MAKSNLRSKRFIPSYNLQPITEEVRAETLRQELEQRLCMNVLYWLAWFAFLYTPCLSGDGTTLSGLAPPTSSVNQENAPTGLPTGQSDVVLFLS